MFHKQCESIKDDDLIELIFADEDYPIAKISDVKGTAFFKEQDFVDLSTEEKKIIIKKQMRSRDQENSLDF